MPKDERLAILLLSGGSVPYILATKVYLTGPGFGGHGLCCCTCILRETERERG